MLLLSFIGNTHTYVTCVTLPSNNKTGGLTIVLGAMFCLTLFVILKKCRLHHRSCNNCKDRLSSWLVSNHLYLDIEILHICKPEVKRRTICCMEQEEFAGNFTSFGWWGCRIYKICARNCRIKRRLLNHSSSIVVIYPPIRIFFTWTDRFKWRNFVSWWE